ncbi:inhibitory POU protein-like [Centruroides vittatus]|uniref:inhibitory POU protein-like n=1 Tax=Centruroides sculpturatus TaxID=218467 RepID=UPI000C6E65FB|nr:inhibitory POU protein-like [Centruroides sculpturatus]
MNSKQHMSLHPSINTGTGTCFPGRYSPNYRTTDPMRRHCMGNPTSNLFAGLDDGLMGRADGLTAVDITKHSPPSGPSLHLKHDMMYPHHPGVGTGHGNPNARPHHTQMGHPGMDTMDLLDPICPSSLPPLAIPSESNSVSSHSHGQLHAPIYSHSMNSMMGSHHSLTTHHPVTMHDADTDPRELEAFAERFKQRRIKLGVTQADVGKALANLKLPGVGSLSQSTICRFESLTLSHNNMVALKPILQAWLEAAESQARNKRRDPDAPCVLPTGEKKRKRTSIAGPEKRSLEAYFAVQPRPSGEKIAAIAEKLDLKKNVVRVWFCNQRQKQKRMKYSAQQH